MNMPTPKTNPIGRLEREIRSLTGRLSKGTSNTGAEIAEIQAGIEDIRARINLLHPPPTYSYTRYATDAQGTGFSITFNPAIHTHRGIYVTTEPLTDSQITADLFDGLWEPWAPDDTCDGGTW